MSERVQNKYDPAERGVVIEWDVHWREALVRWDDDRYEVVAIDQLLPLRPWANVVVGAER